MENTFVHEIGELVYNEIIIADYVTQAYVVLLAFPYV